MSLNITVREFNKFVVINVCNNGFVGFSLTRDDELEYA